MTQAEDGTGPEPPDGRDGDARPGPVDDPVSARALLAALACSRLREFESVARLGATADALTDRLALDGIAAVAHERYRLAAHALVAGDGFASPGVSRPGRTSSSGPVPSLEDALTPQLRAADGFARRAVTSDWYEAVIAQYVDGGVSEDFCRDLATAVGPAVREVVLRVQAPSGFSDWVVARLATQLGGERRLAGRLALWGRRLAGESLSRVQEVALSVPGMPALVAGAAPAVPDASAAGPERAAAALAHLFSRLTAGHSRRMSALGLTA